MTTTTTRVVHCKKEPFDVLIDRRAKWGNPFKIVNGAIREEVIAKYKEYILNKPELLKQPELLK